MVSPQYLRSLHDFLRTEKDDVTVLKEDNRVIFSCLLSAKNFYFEVLGDGKYSKFYPKSWCKMISSLAWNTKLTDYWNILLWIFWRCELRSFFIQKFDGKMIFTWYFLVFDDIIGLGKCGFWCSDRRWISIRINYHLIATNKPTNCLSHNLFYF